MSIPSIAYWPGDVSSASFQSLTFNASTNTLSLTPFGNSVVLNSGTVVTSTINSTTINASTINSSTIEVSPQAGTGTEVIAAVGGGIAQVTFASTNQTISHTDVVYAGGVVNQTFTSEFPANSTIYTMAYTTGPGETAKGSITFFSSINGIEGGVQIDGEGGPYIVVGGGNASIGNSASANGITVNSSGITLNPGSNLPVQLQQGYFNVNNLAMSNVSSINGASQPVTSWINPSVPVNVSTLASSSVLVPALSFSTLSGNVYQINVEYAASNLGGGAANDETTIAITTEGGGHVSVIDSFVTLQTYYERYASPTACITANGNFATLNVANDTAGGEVMLVNFFRLFVKDLGVAVTKY